LRKSILIEENKNWRSYHLVYFVTLPQRHANQRSFMTHPSDQPKDETLLSPNAQHMLALREQVLAEWAKRLRESVDEARALPHPILINTLPSLYENLAQALSPDYPRSHHDEGNTVAAEHGGERARLTDYNAQAVVSEYQLLRWAIFDVLTEAGVQLDNRECHVINAVIDGSIRDAVTAFEAAQTALRERVVAALTHDLRNPLMAAYAAAELIRLGKAASDIPRLAERILENLNRMDGMIRDLLDVAAFQTGERLRRQICQFDLSEVAREVAEQFNTLHGQRILLEPKVAVGYWDREAIKRAIENLAGNALKYGRSGTPVRVRIETMHGRAILAVHNEGDPIPPEQISTVFQVFRRTQATKAGNAQGWGIGLPYVRTVPESHGGSVVIDSSLERGTTFTIDMPLDARPYQDAPIL
jgi:signal transduction histidine kinase